MFIQDKNSLLWEYDGEKTVIEPWGENALRVRAGYSDFLSDEDQALLAVQSPCPEISIEETCARIRNGKITAQLEKDGRMTFTDGDGNILLQEYVRTRTDPTKFCSALNITGREFRPIPGGDYALTVRFESDPDEKLAGMGQYQQAFMNLKGCTLELAQRNSQSSVPFVISDKGYGFLWNDPAVGRVTFAKNITEWHAESTKKMDYWITAGDTPAEILHQYCAVTGTVPMMPEYGLGFWQCKLRYSSQEEVLSVAREYHRRKLPIDVIVVDFFHWTKQGEWQFDPEKWPDPRGMVEELRRMGIKLMVSVWPTVDKTSRYYEEMLEKGYLVRAERGVRTTMEFYGNTVFFDATNPDARRYVWNIIKKNYFDAGIDLYWLDEAEPEYAVYDFDNYRYHIGSVLQKGNIYPLYYAKGFYDGLKEQGMTEIVSLVRCAWAGSQRYGALVWSGDIHSGFETMRRQLYAGLHMGMAGIPWWTTDIGGFHGGNVNDPAFRECLVRWFEYGTFCPVFRIHGDREPHIPTGEYGPVSGADNEVWSYGEENLAIFEKYMRIRENLRPYLRELMKQAHEKGDPVMRPLFYRYPDDPHAWEELDEYLLGDDLLVAPVVSQGVTEREVYLPGGDLWQEVSDGSIHEGGCFVCAAAGLDTIPLFIRMGGTLKRDLFHEIIS